MNSVQEPISLSVSSASLQLGERAIRLELALQLYTRKILNFEQAQGLADVSAQEFQHLLQQKNLLDKDGINSIHPLETGKIYEVWRPCDAPEAAKTLMQLLAAEQGQQDA